MLYRHIYFVNMWKFFLFYIHTFRTVRKLQKNSPTQFIPVENTIKRNHVYFVTSGDIYGYSEQYAYEIMCLYLTSLSVYMFKFINQSLHYDTDITNTYWKKRKPEGNANEFNEAEKDEKCVIICFTEKVLFWWKICSCIRNHRN